jgi:hypothetical protein
MCYDIQLYWLLRPLPGIHATRSCPVGILDLFFFLSTRNCTSGVKVFVGCSPGQHMLHISINILLPQPHREADPNHLSTWPTDGAILLLSLTPNNKIYSCLAESTYLLSENPPPTKTETQEDSQIRSTVSHALTETCQLFSFLAPLPFTSFHFPLPTKHGRSIPTPSLNQTKGVQTAERQRHERLVHPPHSNALFHVRITQHHSRFQDTQKAWFRRDQNRAEVGVVSMSCGSINYVFTSCSGCASCYDAIIWMRAWANEQGMLLPCAKIRSSPTRADWTKRRLAPSK